MTHDAIIKPPISCEDDSALYFHQRAFSVATGTGQQPRSTPPRDQLLKEITALDEWYDTPLNNALLKDNMPAAEEIVRMILQLHAHWLFDYQNSDGHTPLILLAHSTCSEGLAHIFTRFGADVSKVDNMRRSVFHYAVHNSKLRIFRHILANGANWPMLEKLDASQMSPMHLAVLNEAQPEFLRLCLLHCRNVNHISTVRGESALHLAISHHCLRSLQQLLQHDKVDVNLPLYDGRTPLDLAEDCQLDAGWIALLEQRGAKHALEP